MSCCPPNSEVYLAATYIPKGTTGVIGEDTEAYFHGSSSSKKAIIVFPDVWGWNGGRTRNIADQFAEAGYFVIVPKLQVPPLEGGTDGDGLPPDFDIATRGADFGAYFSTITWKDVVGPRVKVTIEYLRGLGIERIATIGFCWGGWAIAHTIVDHPDTFSCGVIFHPSIQLEERLHGGNNQELVSKISSPLLLIPAGNDPDDYRPGGILFETMVTACPQTETIPTQFAEMKHGFVNRGNTEVAEVKAAVEAALENAFGFISKFT